MKKAKKVVALALCAVMLVVGSVAGTMAYLTSNTDVVTNTFTVGNVAITLDETDVDLYGVKDGDTRVIANQYKLVPNHKYVKDPTVHVTAGSEPCWLFVKVDNGLANIEAAGAKGTIAQQMEAKGWTLVSGTTNVYAYEATVDAGSAAVDKVVFEEFTVATNAIVADYANATITIDAYAIQADGFGTAAAAWATAPTTWN